MQEIISNLQDGTIRIYGEFDVNAGTSSVDFAPYFGQTGSEYTICFTNLQNISEFTKFTYDTIGLTDNRYLENFYRISRDGNYWTEWMDLKKNIDNFPQIDPKDPLYLDIKWIRSGSSITGSIRLVEYSIEGLLQREITSGDETILIPSGDSIIWSAPYIYKVFLISDIEVISSSVINDNIDIKYRYSQDNSRTWSSWEKFTKENITTVRINPIRFFQIEYSITNNSSSTISIQDINIIGDFQNVSLDYFKTNLMGIRDCCQSNILGTIDSNGNFIPSDNMTNESNQSSLPVLSDQDKANLYNPYQQGLAADLWGKLSSDAEQIFGFKVIYFVTDPDKNGIDTTFHEYQLFNTVCEGDIKISVDGNNFPDNQIIMNQFDLGLFENMTVHITKKQFKEKFGPQRRPSKEDFIYFCDINRMFQVEHAQQFRNFNNYAVYYKVILKKYSQKANVLSGSQNISDRIKQLTKNSTIDELFGIENRQDKQSVANKEQTKPLTMDNIRVECIAEINKELIENSSTIISKSHYDLSTVSYLSQAVIYKNLNPFIKKSSNIGYQIWFRINNYIEDEIYNFITHYDDQNLLGIKINLSNDRITVTLNSQNYLYDLLSNQIGGVSSLNENVWYCYVANIDQRNNKIEQFIYKRNVEEEDEAAKLTNTILKKEYYNIQDITPIEYIIEDRGFEILASDMCITNIRMFVEVIPESSHNKILNQYIIGDDSKYLIFADNAIRKIVLPKFPLFE